MKFAFFAVFFYFYFGPDKANANEISFNPELFPTILSKQEQYDSCLKLLKEKALKRHQFDCVNFLKDLKKGSGIKFSYEKFYHLGMAFEKILFFQNELRDKLLFLFEENRDRIYKDLTSDELQVQEASFLFDSLALINFYTLKKEITFILLTLENKFSFEKNGFDSRIIELYRMALMTREKNISFFLKNKYEKTLKKEIDFSFQEIQNEYFEIKKSSLILKNFNFPKGDFFIGIMSLTCPQAFKVLKEIKNNIKDYNSLLGKIIFLVPPQGIYSREKIKEWNQENRKLKLQIVGDVNSWPQLISFLETPRFYHFFSGKFKKEITFKEMKKLLVPI